MSRPKTGVTQREAWQRYLMEDQEKIAGEVHWNDDLVVACKDHDVLDRREADELQGRRPDHRGNRFIKYLKEKTAREFAEFANILNSKGYNKLASEMKSMITSQKELHEEIQKDIESRVDTSLRGARLPPTKKNEITQKVADYMQSKAYRWKRQTDMLSGTIDKVNEDIDRMCKRVIEEARGYDVNLPLNVPPTERLDACVTQVADTCNQLFIEKKQLVEAQMRLEQEKADLHRIIQEKVQHLTSQRQKIADTQEQLEQLKKEDKSKARLIEMLQTQLHEGMLEIEQNLSKVKELQNIELEMNDKCVEVAGLKQTLARKNDKIRELEMKLENSETENDRLKGKLDFLQNK